MEQTEEQKAKVKEIVVLRDREMQRQANFRSLWQSISDLMFPQTYGITSSIYPGTELMNHLFDTTAVEESENMTSGLTNNLFPAGQHFFDLKPADKRLAENEEVKRYFAILTEQVHEAISNSNFIAQVNNTIHYWLTFGTGVLYCDWTVRDGLNFRDYAIGTYQCLENSKGIIDSIIMTCPMTARQIRQEWGENSGKSVLEALQKPETSNDEFNVIHVIRPRSDREADKLGAMNMAWESIKVQEKDAVILEESGYDEFPFGIPRYDVLYREVYGRGRGTILLPTVRTLNRLARDYQEMSNKWVNPPLEVLESFEGTVNVAPGAVNFVTEVNSIRGIQYDARGAYPVTKDILEYHREAVRQGFFKNAFEAITPLSGDRRTTTEIIERLKEGMKKLSKPMSRLFIELLAPTISRSVLLLIRNGQVDMPPEVLSGASFKVEFVSPLALALRDQQSRGLQYWVVALGEMEALFPGVTDNVNYDQAARDLGESLGVKTQHIRPIRERDQIRKARLERMARQQAMEEGEVEADVYNKTTKAPEQGSLVEGGA